MPAILDIKWLPRTIANSDPVLAIVDASGFLTLYRVGMSAKSVTLEVLCQSNAVSDTLRLSLEWNCRIDASSPLQIASSDSAGQIALHQFAEGEVALVQEWEAHSFEAWITAFNQWNTSTVYSGGDDSLFRGWDTRTDCTTPIFTSKRHTMGVCSLQSHPSREHILASGSYDEHIRLWDTRSMRAPVEDIRVHGGVWRLKWQAQNPSLIAAAAMHGGVPVVSVDESNKPSLTHRHTAHESIAYGVDWHPQIEGLIASCSFYDHSLHLWRLPTNADMP
ncbi:Wdr85 protein [Capsaspora owczarzaki ATCC 30864]|nr:Wdr85 protein [Capsaspora owczarzaki ATCC 30864]|eukprot:XP_004344287.2 Wdr85 protein [Capsaspora owczarzaki ATCC 30864]